MKEMTQDQLAEKYGVSRAYISDIVRGRVKPKNLDPPPQ